jgi:hypothetical protein
MSFFFAQLFAGRDVLKEFPGIFRDIRARTRDWLRADEARFTWSVHMAHRRD